MGTGTESTDSAADTNHDADSRGRLAAEYSDFNKVTKSLDSASNKIDENEIAFKLRVDERIVPVGPHTDDSHMRIEVLAEVYYKGNRHPTRRRLQGGGSQPLRSQQSIQSLSVPVHYRAAEMVACPVNEKAHEAVINLTLKYGNTAAIPDSTGIPDWIATFVYEMEASIGARSALEVRRVQHGGTVLFEKHFKHGSRRLETDEVQVQLHVKGNGVSTGGQIANVVQERMVSGSVSKVQVFEQTARIVGIDVPDCGAIPDGEFGVGARELESSAAVASTLFAFMVALVHLL